MQGRLHPLSQLLISLLAAAAVSCGGAASPAVESLQIELAERSVVSRAPSEPLVAQAPSPRWRIVAMFARDELGFMREGGLMALSLLHAAELELSDSTVVVTLSGAPFATGALVQDGAAVRLTFDDDTSTGLAGELGTERAGQRSLVNTWATFTLERSMEPDARVKLCGSEGAGTFKALRALTRRVACEAHETEISPTGAAVAAAP